jgi:hypothetical protein
MDIRNYNSFLSTTQTQVVSIKSFYQVAIVYEHISRSLRKHK